MSAGRVINGHEIRPCADLRCADLRVGWGANAKPDREVSVWFDSLARLGGRVVHLGLTNGGHPRHPLYLPADSGQRVYAGPNRIEAVR